MGIRPAEDPFMKRMAIEKNVGQRIIMNNPQGTFYIPLPLVSCKLNS